VTVLAPVLAAHPWPSNAELIEACARLDYLDADALTLDATFGRGIFWRTWRPRRLITADKSKGRPMLRADFTRLPFPDHTFDRVILDPPYKLNGTDAGEGERYGVERYASWQGRHQLIRGGITDCARVLRPAGVLLVKCQDQVCSGAVRWQTDEFTRHAESLGLDKVDRLDRLGHRPQPAGRRQVHAHGRPSSLLVFRAPAAAVPAAPTLFEVEGRVA
jgi:SAM-dependent methyltransferase